MRHSGEIGVLKLISDQRSMQPQSWRIFETTKNQYQLEFTYMINENPEYLAVHTARGEIKVYKSLNAVFNDISKIQPNALVHWHAHVAGTI